MDSTLLTKRPGPLSSEVTVLFLLALFFNFDEVPLSPSSPPLPPKMSEQSNFPIKKINPPAFYFVFSQHIFFVLLHFIPRAPLAETASLDIFKHPTPKTCTFSCTLICFENPRLTPSQIKEAPHRSFLVPSFGIMSRRTLQHS